ncbi:MAG: BatD family protein [Bacteroidales bacterium]|jgi:hypothetical protein|nr:BatD family protein [Bacteroidales bacterium]
MRKKLLIILVISLATLLPAKAQVSVFIPDTVKQVGDELSLTLSYTSSNLEHIRFPQIATENFSGIEFFPVIPKSDTLQTKGNYSQLVTYKFAVYEAGEYTIPPLQFYINPNSPSGQIVYSDTFKFTVSYPAVDTTADIRDIAPIEKIGFGERFVEFLKSNWLTITIVAVSLALIALGLLYFLKRRKDEPLFLRPRKPALSPRQAALQALKELHEKKLWQQNAIKEYYTVLTDILRQYLYARYDIAALEMTSDEVLDAFTATFPNNKNATQDFGFVLTTADLAKFAKSTPLPSDNETCYAMVLKYIESETEIEAPKQEQEPEQTQEQSTTKNTEK